MSQNTQSRDKQSKKQQSTAPIQAEPEQQRLAAFDINAIVQRARKFPDQISSQEGHRLQRAIGNQATRQLFAKATPRKTQANNTTTRSTTESLQQLLSTRLIQFKSANAASNGEETDGSSKTDNKTGLPDHQKDAIENLSGYSMDDVQVHFNSSKPAQIQAHAYAQGTNIHLGPGKEKYLPHEAWHVVQQKQGRVKPTLQLKKVNINDETHLEAEADRMSRRITRFSKEEQGANRDNQVSSPLSKSSQTTVQRVLDPEILLRGTIKAGTDVFVAINNSYAGTFDNLTHREFTKHEDEKLYFDNDEVYVLAENVDLDRYEDVRGRLFDGIPHPVDVIQGELGDCYLLAAAASIADRNYKKIEEMFQDEGDKVKVRLFNVTGEEGNLQFTPQIVTVNKSIVKKSDGSAAYAKKHLWVQMLEKAYAAANIDPNSVLTKPMQSASYKNLHGGGTLSLAFQVLLGGEAEIEHIFSGYGRADNNILPWSSDERKNYKEGNLEQLVSWTIFKEDVGKITTWMNFVTFDDSFNGPIDKMFNKRTEFTGEEDDKKPYYDKEIKLHHFREVFEAETLDATVASVMMTWLEQSGYYPGKKGEYRTTEDGGKEAKYSGEQIKAFNKIKDAIEQNQPVALKTKSIIAPKSKQDEDSSPTGEAKGKGFLGGHFYTVLDYDDADDIIKDLKLKWVKVRNPWGKYGIENDYQQGMLTRAKVEGGNGQFWLELNDVTKFFMTVHTGPILERP